MDIIFFRKNQRILFFIGIFIVLVVLLNYLDLLSTDEINTSYHLSLLTINSIFAGFLFTSLGIMAGIADKKSLLSLEKGGYMDKYYNSIYVGLFFNIISIVISTIGVVFSAINTLTILISIQQLSLIAGIIFFILSVIQIIVIIGKIRMSLK